MTDEAQACKEVWEMKRNQARNLAHNEGITDRSGNPCQYFHYTAWGESFAQAEATQGSFSSSYRFNAKKLDHEPKRLKRWARELI